MTGSKCDNYLEEIQEQMDGDVFKAMLEIMARQVMEAEITRHVDAMPYERTSKRRGSRNGYKPRTLNTRMGQLDLRIPQARNVEPYSPTLFAKWQRSERALLVACAEMYFMGVSTRKVKRVLREMGGFELSAATVSRVASEIDERLAEFRQRRLDGQAWPFILVDATYVKVRKNGRIVDQAVLVIAGVNGAGNREILTWRMADVESEDTWSEVFLELKLRGVSGVEWLVSDGHSGIRAAFRAVFSGVSWQRCWTHFMRNLLKKVSHKERAALAKEMRGARGFEALDICLAEAERIAARLERRWPRAARQIRDQFEETLAVHVLPRKVRRRVYTTNLMERLMKEIKRRTRVVGVFPNDASADRLIGAQLLERDEAWHCAPARYLAFDDVAAPLAFLEADNQ